MKLNPQNIEKHKWVKGKSGNPKGRPKLPDLKKAIAKQLSEKVDGVQALDSIIKALIKKAKQGDVKAIQELLDRGYGKSVQFIEGGLDLVVINAVGAPPPDGDLPGQSTGDESGD